MKPKVDPKIVIDFLNEMFSLDPVLTETLIKTRFQCNEKITSHETIQVLCDPDGSNPQVGLLGILNGLVGCDDVGYGFIYAEFDSNNHGLLGFSAKKEK